MFCNNSFYKSSDLNNINKRFNMHNFFNPYEYNFESNIKDNLNTDIDKERSKNHTNRNDYKKR